MTQIGPSELQVILATRDRQSDENLADSVIELINGASKQIRVATQQLEEENIVNALIAARRRGCQVQVLIEADYLAESHPLIDPWQTEGRNEINRQVFSALLRAKITVRLDRSSQLFHSNFIVIDPNKANAAVLLTTANLTPIGLRGHWNSNVVLQNSEIASTFAREFNAMWSSASQAKESPLEIQAGGIPVKVVFGPIHQPEMEVMKQVAKARDRVRFAMYTFSQTSGIDDVLVMAASQGSIDIAGVLDEQIRNQRWVASHHLETAGITISWLGSSHQKLHQKLVTIDDKVAIVGTFNFTRSARFSHETLIVIGDMANTGGTKQQRLVQGIEAEIERLISAGRSGHES